MPLYPPLTISRLDQDPRNPTRPRFSNAVAFSPGPAPCPGYPAYGLFTFSSTLARSSRGGR